ncbi:MAG TPA: HAMP domain-containing histidine kinase [Candidatus Intestinimonas stercorigallinarum]|nr:HAMP domain-containing histidine kinase [Candidatus Intestinimonas stercorigallinarum]
MDQSDQMAALVSSLLDLSRMKAGKTHFAPGPVALDRVVGTVFRTLERPMETAGVTLDLDLAPCAVSGEEGRLSLVVSNLAANALQHTPPGGEIRVRLRAEGSAALLQVENDGDPIPAEALPRLFEPFYRSDAARDRARGGAGLGLALVNESVALHGGACGAENLPHGVRFWVELPLLR